MELVRTVCTRTPVRAAGRIRRATIAMDTDHPDTATSVTIVALGYRARCTEPECENLGRLILRYADSGGRPILDNLLASETGTVCHMQPP
jgi:hypothetical protein